MWWVKNGAWWSVGAGFGGLVGAFDLLEEGGFFDGVCLGAEGFAEAVRAIGACAAGGGGEIRRGVAEAAEMGAYLSGDGGGDLLTGGRGGGDGGMGVDSGLEGGEVCLMGGAGGIALGAGGIALSSEGGDLLPEGGQLCLCGGELLDGGALCGDAGDAGDGALDEAEVSACSRGGGDLCLLTTRENRHRRLNQDR